MTNPFTNLAERAAKDTPDGEHVRRMLFTLQGLIDDKTLCTWDPDTQTIKQVVSLSLNGGAFQLNLEKDDARDT